MKCHSIIALALLLFLGACADVETPKPASGAEGVELSFAASDRTKGVVEGDILYDAGEASWRSLLVTAHLKPAIGQQFSERPYFTAETFSRSGDGRWSHDPAVYWPVGGTLDILALSSSEPFPEPDVVWFKDNAASGVRIAVDRHRTQDDILFGSLWQVGNNGGTTQLEMQHAQAYVEVRCRKSGGTAATVDSVVLNGVYLEGDLEIENNVGAPRMDWNFRRFRAYDVLVDDPNGVYGTALTSTQVSLSMLIPEQEKTSITVVYHIDGERKEQTVALAHERWLAGGRYVYEIGIGPDPANGHAYVDLGLRSGGNKILFATMNIGASAPQEYGDYFAWGETSKRYTSIDGTSIIGGTFDYGNAPFYDPNTMMYSKYTYIDFKETLDAEDDVAVALWGGSWRMPDKNEFQFLLNSTYCTYEWVSDYNSTGVAGLVVTGKGNYASNSVFFPAASGCHTNSIISLNSSGVYWSRTCELDYPWGNAFCLRFNENNSQADMALSRHHGYPVRPVLVIPE